MSRRDGTEREVERLARKPRHLRFVGDLERGIDVGLERKLAQQAEAERVDRRDLDVGDALAQPRARRRARARRDRRAACSSASTRLRISAAALRVNVIARMWRGSTPGLDRARRTDRRARASSPSRPTPRARRRVADRRRSPARPDRPARFASDEASNRLGCFIVLEPVFLAADARVAAPGTIARSCAASAGTRPPRCARRCRRTARRGRSTSSSARAPSADRAVDLAVVAKREVHRRADLVRVLVARLQPLPRAVGVDRNLHGRLQVRHLAELVVDHANRAVVEHVEAIGLAADLDVFLDEAGETREAERARAAAARRGDRRSCRPRRPRARTRARPCRGSRSSRTAESLRARDPPRAARRATRRRSRGTAAARRPSRAVVMVPRPSRCHA